MLVARYPDIVDILFFETEWDCRPCIVGSSESELVPVKYFFESVAFWFFSVSSGLLKPVGEANWFVVVSNEPSVLCHLV